MESALAANTFELTELYEVIVQFTICKHVLVEERDAIGVHDLRGNEGPLIG
jgi:hypothetical protein